MVFWTHGAQKPAAPRFLEEYSTGAGLGAAFEQAWAQNPVRSIADIETLETAELGSRISRFGGRRAPDSELMSAEEANHWFGIAGELTFDQPARARAARIRYDWKRDEIRRRDILARASQTTLAAAGRLGASFVAQALDPLNIASAFIPVVGEARYARMLQLAATPMSRFGVRAGTKPVSLKRAAADFSEDGRSVSQALDDSDESGWGVDGQQGRAHAAIFLPGKPIRSGAAGPTTLTFRLEHNAPNPKHSLGRFRLSVTDAPNPWGGFRVPEEVKKVLDTPAAARTAEQTKALTDYFRPLASSLDTPRDLLAKVRHELEAIQIPSAMILRERAGFERPSTPLRIRGSYMSPGERVYASTPAFLPPLQDSQPTNRLGVAHWLVDEDNPLTARVTVNRFWEQVFGRGLVLTSEDFGTQGDPPTHPELLDWLATTFMAQGWSMKAIQRFMVTSATYRQSSRSTPALVERDPGNGLLARGPRFRVEAETVRDIALAVSGLLSSKLGGPSVFPDQPDGVWDNPYSSDKWTLSEGEDRYRRSLYTFARRTAPYPMLTTFDAPSREFCTVRRVRTNTPLQALTTLNDPAFFTAARALADRVLREAGPEPEARAVHAFRLCTARRPSATEVAPLLRFYRDQAARFAVDGAAAQAVAGRSAEDHRGDPAGDDGRGANTIIEKAAWSMVANVVLNLDETVTKE